MTNNIEEKKYLPIGTVVKLKSATKNVMITSYLVFPNGENAKNENKNVMYDYGGCSFPEGIIDSSVSLAFNHSDIDEIIHMGLTNEAQANFAKILDENTEKIRSTYQNLVSNNK